MIAKDHNKGQGINLDNSGLSTPVGSRSSSIMNHSGCFFFSTKCHNMESKWSIKRKANFHTFTKIRMIIAKFYLTLTLVRLPGVHFGTTLACLNSIDYKTMMSLRIQGQNEPRTYCRTGNFRDRIFLRIRVICNPCAGNFSEFLGSWGP